MLLQDLLAGGVLPCFRGYKNFFPDEFGAESPFGSIREANGVIPDSEDLPLCCPDYTL